MFSLHRFNQTRKRLKQKATLGSLLVVILIFGLFFEAYMHNFNLVYILLFFIFSFALIASPLGILNFDGLELKLERTDRLFAKERSLIYFSLYSDKTSDSYALSFECDTSKTFIPFLSAGETKILSIPLTPPSRVTPKSAIIPWKVLEGNLYAAKFVCTKVTRSPYSAN